MDDAIKLVNEDGELKIVMSDEISWQRVKRVFDNRLKELGFAPKELPQEDKEYLMEIVKDEVEQEEWQEFPCYDDAINLAVNNCIEVFEDEGTIVKQSNG